MHLHNTILDFTHTPYKIDIVYVNDVVQANYLYNISNLGENMCTNSILFKIKCKLSSTSIDYIKNLNLYK